MKELVAVKDWMISPVIVVTTDMPISSAYDLMKQYGIRRLPVTHDGKLVGIVTLGDLREARPSPATSLSIYEMNYLLAKLTVGQVMTHHPYTVSPDLSVQQAASLMLERKVGGLPVVDKDYQVVGIITESDIFRMLINKWEYFADPFFDPGRVSALVANDVGP